MTTTDDKPRFGAAQVLVRWMDVTTLDCIQDEGIRHTTCLDFARINGVFVTSNVLYAKMLIVEALIEDELVDINDGEDNETPAMEVEFEWEQSTENATEWHVSFRGHHVASAVIAPIEVLVPAGGPT